MADATDAKEVRSFLVIRWKFLELVLASRSTFNPKEKATFIFSFIS